MSNVNRTIYIVKMLHLQPHNTLENRGIEDVYILTIN